MAQMVSTWETSKVTGGPRVFFSLVPSQTISEKFSTIFTNVRMGNTGMEQHANIGAGWLHCTLEH